jgi:putative flippase GtrA
LVGLINSLIGYGVIFGAIARGFSPYASNFLGYALGFLCSFVLHRRWVFAAGGNVLRQFWRFLLAFLAAYAVNFATLHLLLRFDASPLWAQFPAALAYFLCMYAISRWWVFRGWARE